MRSVANFCFAHFLTNSYFVLVADLRVTLEGSAYRDAENGLVFDGGQGWAEIDGWEWGGEVVSFELLVDMSFDEDSRQRIFDFGGLGSSDDR